MSEKMEMMADMVKSLAALLAERYSEMTMVMDEQTHFYHQSPRYVFAFLEEELAKGKFE